MITLARILLHLAIAPPGETLSDLEDGWSISQTRPEGSLVGFGRGLPQLLSYCKGISYSSLLITEDTVWLILLT